MRWSTWIPWVDSGEEAKLEPLHSDLRDGGSWPMPAQSIVRAWHEDDDYVIDIELRLDDVDRPVVTGIAIRRAVPLKSSRDFKREPRWPAGTEPRAVRPRDVKRLPLSVVTKAAVAWVTSTQLEPESPERALELGKVKRTLQPPRSRPRTDPDFYRKILLLYNELAARGERSPAKMLAEQMGEPVSTVHVWLHRAKRKLVGDARA
jgi:hypothetical protein